jgi:hypothetical protein
MLYGAKCWPNKRRNVQQLNVAKMHMLRWICGHTRRDHVRNDDIRDGLEVAPIKKFVQHRLRCVKVDWDISRYGRASPNMVGYVRIY